MNQTAIEMLEFNKIKEILSGYTVSEQGKDLINRLNPSGDLKTVQHWLNETTEAKAIIKKSSSIPLHHLTGMKQILQKIDTEMNLQPQELTNIMEFLKNGEKLKRFMRDKEILAPTVSSYAYSIFELDNVSGEIDRCIRYDQVDDKATPQLGKIRKKITVLEEKIKSKLESILKSSQNKEYIQENLISIRNGRYVIPVKKAYKSNIDGTVLDTSSSGSTVFVEPFAITRLQEELNMLRYEEEKEVYQILTYLTGMVSASKREISINIETVAHYDFIFAKAKYSKSIDGNSVELNTEKIISVKGAKHPLIDSSAVPLDFSIGREYNSLLITGPNTGGKTVALKTVGLLTIMAQSGLHVPVSEGSQLAIFQDILVDIGDGQSIEQSLSTFSSHVRNIISIMECADPRTLVIMDELGAGTDPAEGSGLAMAILEDIHNKGATILATTHYSEIKDFAKEKEGFENGSMEFDLNTLRPTYRLKIGESGNSNAFLIALKLGMNQSVIERAHEITYKEKKGYKEVIDEFSNITLKNVEMTGSHSKEKIKAEKVKEVRKKIEKQKVKSTFKIGDAVYISSFNTTGIVCELENSKGELSVLVNKKKLKVNKKRLSLYIDGKDLYPENYDLDIVLETKENRKKRNLMKRKFVKDLSIEVEKGDQENK